MTTKGYTKSKLGKINLFAVLSKNIYKDPNEPFEVWFNRKTAEAINGGTDEQGLNRKAEVQNPNPSFNL